MLSSSLVGLYSELKASLAYLGTGEEFICKARRQWQSAWFGVLCLFWFLNIVSKDLLRVNKLLFFST